MFKKGGTPTDGCPYSIKNINYDVCKTCGYRCTKDGWKEHLNTEITVESKIERKKVNARYLVRKM